MGALLDTGSEISLITLSLAKRLNLLFKADSQWTMISGIGGNTIPSYTSVDTVLMFINSEDHRVRNPKMPVRLNIVDKGKEESLTLGVDILSKYDLLLDYRATFGRSPSICTDPTSQDPLLTPVQAPLYSMCTKRDLKYCNPQLLPVRQRDSRKQQQAGMGTM